MHRAHNHWYIVFLLAAVLREAEAVGLHGSAGSRYGRTGRCRWEAGAGLRSLQYRGTQAEDDSVQGQALLHPA
ncbi:hypothetical protein D3C76_1835840 [compost metagenome]